MEWYHIKIKWWYGNADLRYSHCVIPAKSYGEALNEVLKDYAPEEIEDISMWQDDNYDYHGYVIDEGEVNNE